MKFFNNQVQYMIKLLKDSKNREKDLEQKAKSLEISLKNA